MAVRDIIVTDECWENFGDQMQKRCADLEEVYDTYIDILRKVSEYGIIEGYTAEALKAFTGKAEKLKTELEQIGLEIYYACDNYVREIDEADKDLY